MGVFYNNMVIFLKILKIRIMNKPFVVGKLMGMSMLDESPSIRLYNRARSHLSSVTGILYWT